MTKPKHIDFDLVKSFLSYDGATGEFRWLSASRKKTQVGKLAGRIGTGGYVYITIKRSNYSAARIAWILTHGEIDLDKQIDHINRIPNDNRLCNLRLVSPSENAMNKASHKGEYPPKRYTKNGNKYQVYVRGKYIGLYATISLAEEAVRKELL